MDDFASLDTPGGPGAIKVVEIFVFEIFSAVLWMLAPPGEKICLLQIEASCHLYYFSCLKSDNITLHSHNSITLKEIHSFKP